jgi:hypothetical protein
MHLTYGFRPKQNITITTNSNFPTAESRRLKQNISAEQASAAKTGPNLERLSLKSSRNLTGGCLALPEKKTHFQSLVPGRGLRLE